MMFLFRIFAVCAVLAGLLWFEFWYEDKPIEAKKPLVRMVYQYPDNDNMSDDEDVPA